MLALPLRTQFHKQDWSVRRISLAFARPLVEQWHYAKRCSTWSVYCFGLFLRGDANVWGTTIWLPPAKFAVDKFNPGGYGTSLILSRMVIHPLVPRNGASFLLSASVKHIQDIGHYDFLLTYADTWRNHDGSVYRAANWHYQGLSEATQVWLDNAGILISSYRDGRKRNKADMEMLGYSLLGYYPKHIYSLHLKGKSQLIQRELWEWAE